MNLIRTLHRALVVRDDDELRAALEFADQAGERGQTELVERRVDLVHHAERARIEQEEREYQRHRAQRFLAAREQADLLDLFARRLNQDIHPGLEHILGRHQFEPALAAAQKLGEQLGEVARRTFESFAEAAARLAIELLDRLRQVLDRRFEVGALAAEHARALFQLLDLAVGGEIDFAQTLGLGAQLGKPRFVGHCVARRQRLTHLILDRGKLGLEFFRKAAPELRSQSARALASERAVHRFALERLGPSARLVQLSLEFLQLGVRLLTRDSHFGRDRLEFARARARGLGVARELFELARELDPLFADARERGAILDDLRLVLVGETTQMSQFLLDRVEPGPARLDPRGRLKHRARRFLGAGLARAYLGAHRGQALAPGGLAVRQLFEPRVGFGKPLRDFVEPRARLLGLITRGSGPVLGAFDGATAFAQGVFGARQRLARIAELAPRGLQLRARRVEGRAQCGAFALRRRDPRRGRLELPLVGRG